ncbi:hypothetical protein [Fundidesulfovibrio butyratiphilus]
MLLALLPRHLCLTPAWGETGRLLGRNHFTGRIAPARLVFLGSVTLDEDGGSDSLFRG